MQAAIREAPSTGVGLDGDHLYILKSAMSRSYVAKSERKKQNETIKRVVPAGKTSTFIGYLLDNEDVCADIGTGVANKEGPRLHAN